MINYNNVDQLITALERLKQLYGSNKSIYSVKIKAIFDKLEDDLHKTILLDG